MSVILQREIEKLKRHILALCAVVEEQVQRSVAALLHRDAELAEAVKQRDGDVDQREVEIEEECLKVLALHQPVASDLRFIVAVLKINSDLERIGDLAVNIARKAERFAAAPPMEIPFDLAAMAVKARDMLRDAIDAMVNSDARLANDVCGRDDAVDRMKRENRLTAEELIRQRPQQSESLLLLVAVSRNLERVADLATNIAEDAVYMIEGRIVRHQDGAW